jgi:serine/threonine-protein kinase
MAPTHRPPSPRRSSTTKVGALIAGRYAVRGRIGEGGMARVYRAEDALTGEEVAIKILEPEHVVRPGGMDAFLREAAAARAASHPNIVRTLEAGQRGDGRPYLVMELLEGETLGERLARERVVPVLEAIRVAVEIADGLAAAHAAGIVHRDVKPDNVFLVGPRGAPRGAKLLDFGLAAIEVDEPATTGGIAAGTMSTMAPEQVLDDGVDGRTDVYGLGVVLFHALTGQLPFEGPEDLVVLAHQVFSPAPPVSWIAEGLPPGVEQVVAAALRKSPEHRYPTMDALRADLARLARVPPLEVDPPRLGAAADAYEPRTEHARAALAFLRARL